MPAAMIHVENLGKKYTLTQQNGRVGGYRRLGEELVEAFWRPFRGKRPHFHLNSGKEDFWALRNVSFEVNEGEVLGIIGRNGAGKSTLLKILSRITEPSAGRVKLQGRVGSLLEVGTGFHPELSGRENIYLNGALLGMRRAEITKRFDDIVNFAEAEKFLDTPVKRYSSGMYMRLAFAVAAHLDPEILIVDEVLAVGDMAFQQKCMNKMGDAARGGRTIIFVSHNLSAVRNLCARVCVIQQGNLLFDGPVDQGLILYSAESKPRSDHWVRPPHTGGKLYFAEVALELKGHQPAHTLAINLRLHENGGHLPAFIALDIADEVGVVLMQALPRSAPFLASNGRGHIVQATIELPPLIPGNYSVTPWVGPHNTETYDIVEMPVGFLIEESPTEHRTFPHSRAHGSLVPRSELEYYPM